MKKIEVNLLRIVLLLILIIIFSSFASAGIGIKKYQESIAVNENEESCITVGAYNPFPTGTNVVIGVSDELKGVLVTQEAESKYLPPETSSDEAINLKFCFKVPEVYSKDCYVLNNFICKLECTEEQKVYEGEIFLKSIPESAQFGGAGGSTTTMSISQDMRVRVNCNPYPRNYTLVYVIVAIISALVIFTILFRKYRKPKAERNREKLRRLRAEIAKESKGHKKK